VRSKADIGQLNLPHGTNNLKVENRKKIKKPDMLRSIGKQSGGIHGVLQKKERKATRAVGRICRK